MSGQSTSTSMDFFTNEPETLLSKFDNTNIAKTNIQLFIDLEYNYDDVFSIAIVFCVDLCPVRQAQWFVFHSDLSSSALNPFWIEKQRIYQPNHTVLMNNKRIKTSLYDILTTRELTHTIQEIDNEIMDHLQWFTSVYHNISFSIFGYGVTRDLYLMSKIIPNSYHCIYSNLVHQDATNNVHGGDVISPGNTCDVSCLKNILVSFVPLFPRDQVRRSKPHHDSLRDVQTAFRYVKDTVNILNQATYALSICTPPEHAAQTYRQHTEHRQDEFIHVPTFSKLLYSNYNVDDKSNLQKKYKGSTLCDLDPNSPPFYPTSIIK